MTSFAIGPPVVGGHYCSIDPPTALPGIVREVLSAFCSSLNLWC
jgi:hypothetical protein